LWLRKLRGAGSNPVARSRFPYSTLALRQIALWILRDTRITTFFIDVTISFRKAGS